MGVTIIPTSGGGTALRLRTCKTRGKSEGYNRSEGRVGVISRPGAARPRADSDGVTPVPPFLWGPRHANPMARVSDDDGFVRPRTGGSQVVFNRFRRHRFWSAAIPLPLFHARFSGTVTVDPSLTFRARKEPDVLDLEIVVVLVLVVVIESSTKDDHENDDAHTNFTSNGVILFAILACLARENFLRDFVSSCENLISYESGVEPPPLKRFRRRPEPVT